MISIVIFIVYCVTIGIAIRVVKHFKIDVDYNAPLVVFWPATVMLVLSAVIVIPFMWLIEKISGEDLFP